MTPDPSGGRRARRPWRRSAPAPEPAEPAEPGGSRGRRTFVLGTGAHKAGTTWLHAYLRASPHFEPGARKEYHVFDSLDLPSEAWMRRRLVDHAATALEAIRQGGRVDANHLLSMAMYADTELYFDYFAALVSRRPRVRATGDLTPAYAMLSAERLASIRAGFEKRGVRSVGVFLMRDPVDRVWSHIRMTTHREPGKLGRTSEEELLHAHDRRAYALRTQYHRTLDNLAAAFPDASVHVGLYETLFRDDRQVRAIAELVGIPFRPPSLDRHRNASPRSVETLPDEVARVVAEHYADTYRGVAERMPHLDIARWWPHSRHVL